MFMLVRRPDGGPTGYPMTGMLRDGELEITTYRKAAKARYLLADDRVCCVVRDDARPDCGVGLYGHALADRERRVHACERESRRRRDRRAAGSP